MVSATFSRSEHAPNGGDIAEGEVAGAVRLARPGPGQAGHDLVRRAEVTLGDDPGLTPYPGRLDEVVIGLVALLLPDDRCHILGNTPWATR